MKIRADSIHSVTTDVVLRESYDIRTDAPAPIVVGRVITLWLKDGRLIKTIEAKITKKNNIKLKEPKHTQVPANAAVDAFFYEITRLGAPLIIYPAIFRSFQYMAVD